MRCNMIASKEELFVKNEVSRLKKSGVKIELVSRPTVKYGNTECNGYFNDVPTPYLTVGIDKKFNEWFSVFVHETCHADQFLEQAIVWTKKIGNCEPMAILDLWLDHHIELNPKQLHATIQGALQIELDCEKRAVEKYKINNLDFNEEEYIQKANSYIYFYTMMAENRQWYKKAPYTIPEIWKKMPIEFQPHYIFIPHQYIKLYEACYDSPT